MPRDGYNRVNFSPKKRDALRKKYDQAVEDGKDHFMLDDDKFVTGYAKYLLQYLDGLYDGL
jgi:hypothetical protein